jgi:hypothetical protein
MSDDEMNKTCVSCAPSRRPTYAAFPVLSDMEEGVGIETRAIKIVFPDASR